MSPRRHRLASAQGDIARNHTECVRLPTKDTRPAHGDSRGSGSATYPQAKQPTSCDQDQEPQGSMAGTGPNPNASGPTAREIVSRFASKFEDSDGYCQMNSQADDDLSGGR